MRKLAAVALALVAAAITTGAEAQTHRNVVMAQLDSVARRMGSDGYLPEKSATAGDAVVGLLPRSGSVMLEINLRAGASYLISAGCDADCSDLDLRLLAQDMQTVIDEDVADDDVPVLAFTADRSGPHLLAVMMPGCSTDLCYFGVRVFAK